MSVDAAGIRTPLRWGCDEGRAAPFPGAPTKLLHRAAIRWSTVEAAGAVALDLHAHRPAGPAAFELLNPSLDYVHRECSSILAP